MADMLCWQTTWCAWPPRAAAPLRADCVVDDDVDGYEELPVSVPPHFPRGLSREDDSSSLGGEEDTFAVEEVAAAAPSSDGGGGGGLAGAGAWLARVCRSVYGKVAGPFLS